MVSSAVFELIFNYIGVLSMMYFMKKSKPVVYIITHLVFVLPQLGAPVIGFISLYFEIEKIQDAIFAFDVYFAYAILIAYNFSVGLKITHF